MNNLQQNKQSFKFLSSPESPQRIYDFLENHQTGVLSTTNPENNPHAAVVYFSTNKDFEITFATKSQTKKYENMHKNNNVVLVAFDEYTQTTIQIIGVVEEVTGTKATQEILTHMVKAAQKSSEEGDPPLTKLYAGHYVGFRLHPSIIHMAMFLRPDPSGYDLFETIQFSDDK